MGLVKPEVKWKIQRFFTLFEHTDSLLRDKEFFNWGTTTHETNNTNGFISVEPPVVQDQWIRENETKYSVDSFSEDKI